MRVSEAPRRRPRILQLAYICSPGHGSEAAVGWNWAVQASRFADICLITGEFEHYADDLFAYLQGEGAIPGLRIEHLTHTRLERVLKRVPGLLYLAYNLWQRRALDLARRLHDTNHFDLVHQVTIIGFREPGYLWKLPLPFVWGPVGGTQNFPWRFLASIGPRGLARETLRNIVNSLQLKFSRRVRQAAREAAILMAATSTSERDLLRWTGVPSKRILETGVSGRADRPPDLTAKGCLRILWCGRLEPFKGLHLLIQALARLPEDVLWEVRVVGDGPMRRTWQRLAKRKGVAHRISWVGRVPHEEALLQFNWANVFVFTSLRDTSGTVILEAMAAGLPIVCLDHQGAHDIVDDDCGVRVQLTSPGKVAAELAHALTELARKPRLRMSLAQRSYERVGEFLWSEQGRRLATVYGEVLSGRGQLPLIFDEKFSFAARG